LAVATARACAARSKYQTSCIHREFPGPAQAERMRVPLADGTLVATPEVPEADVVPDFLAASNVLGTGWFGAVAAEAGPGKTVAVVGDGAVGLLGMMAAQQLGAERSVWSPVSPALGTASVWSPVSPALGVRRPSMPAMRAASASCWHTA
jgi:threonine dehydrogenase-like Zn-dependent dehydrogenase